MRDDEAQARGAFTSGNPGAKGSRLTHTKLIEFIGRNYAPDAQGAWYFQNGPQKVYVELEAAPWIWRIHGQDDIRTHTGLSAGTVDRCLIDESGRAFLCTTQGIGLVHTQDVVLLESLLSHRGWPLQEMSIAEIAQQFGYLLSPQKTQK